MGWEPLTSVRRLQARLSRDKDASQLLEDVDRIWRFGACCEDDGRFLRDLALFPPDAAADLFLDRMRQEAVSAGLPERLGSVGIVVGSLTPNRAAPSGVYGIWRSTMPIVLLDRRTRLDADMLHKVAREIGHLVYGNRRDDAGAATIDRFAEIVEHGIAVP